MYILSAIIVTNISGYLLKYLELDTFVILLGFRMHISLVIPALFIVGRIPVNFYKNEFSDPPYKKNYPYVIAFSILLLLFALSYLWGAIELGDPEYFYELGLSSIVDLPMYLLWNSVQLTLFYFFLICAFERKNFRVPVLFVSAVSPFAFEFISIENVDITGLAVLALIGITTVIIISRFRNIYWFVIFFFLTFWIFILLFGSASPVLIKLIIASEYTFWEGFFVVNKSIEAFMLPVYSAVISLVIFILSLFRNKGNIIL